MSVLTNFQLKKEDRILKRDDYLSISNKAKRVGTPNFLILYSENKLGTCRLGITASKKAGGAVQRNRIKRIVREFFRINRCFLSNSKDYIIIAGRRASQLGYREVKEELFGALGRKGIIRAVNSNYSG